MNKKPTIGFIGQGFIGKNYADDFEERGFEVIRYDIDKYQNNRPRENALHFFLANNLTFGPMRILMRLVFPI